MNQHEKGMTGEAIAQTYLKNQGYRILTTNFRLRNMAEIDVIAMDKDVLAFVEVKMRTGNKAGSGREAVTKTKQQHIRLAASYYLQKNKLTDVFCRFDVLEITAPAEDTAIELIKNAF